MSEAIDEGKELLADTVRAFKAGLHGEEFRPGEAPPLGHDDDDERDHRYDQLTKLHALHTGGALTDDEFEREKHKLLDTD